MQTCVLCGLPHEKRIERLDVLAPISALKECFDAYREKTNRLEDEVSRLRHRVIYGEDPED